MRKIPKHISKSLIALLIFSWLFSGWPQIWQNPPAPLDKYLTGPFPPEIQKAHAQSSEAMMVYALGTNVTPKFRVWDGSAWGAEQSATAVGGTIQYMVIKFARTRNEAILGTLDSIGDIRVQNWNGSTWSVTTLLANVGTTNDARRGFDIEYETNGDRAIVVYNNANSADPAYRIWNGSTWSSPVSITDPPTTGAPLWIELAPNPLGSSNEIAMMLLDANIDVYGMVWTGSAWSTMGVATVWDALASIATKKAIDVAYEQTSGRAMFIWGDSVATDQYYRIWNGTSLTTATLLDIAAQGGLSEWVRLVPDPSSGSNRLMYGAQDAGADLNTRLWSGSAWDTATQHPEHDAGTEAILDRNFDIVFETYSANAGKAWLVWGDGVTVSRKQWSGIAWGTATTDGDDTALVVLTAQPTTGAVFSGIYQDSGSLTDDILENNLTGGGATWSGAFTIWAGPTLVNPVMEPLAITARRFVSFEQSAYRWFNNTDSTDVGTPLAAQDTAATLGSAGAAFRLRALLHIGASQLPLSGQQLKLQFAARSGTCDTAFSGETYADVTAATVIAYNDNTTPADDAALTANANDPTHGADTIVNQTYEELNNFTNSVAAISAGQDGKWDFSLKDNSAPTSTAYCLRLVKSDGTTLNTYTVIPEITTATVASLTFTVDTSSVFIGSFTPGTPISSSTVLTVNTNSSTGYNISINRASTTPTLFLDSDTIPDTPNSNNWTAPAATSTVGPSAVWTVGTTKGLGFRLKLTGTVSNTYSTAWWGTDDTSGNALYSGISTSTAAQMIANTTLGSGSNENTTVEYRIDVVSTQKSGSYISSPITYTAVVNP